MRPSPWEQRYAAMSREERLSLYDSHNGDTRLSNDLNKRLHGVCGCTYCAATRKLWAANLAPINDPSRKGSNSMSSINVCDRCGGLVTGVALGQVTLQTSADMRTSETVHAEICPGCIAEIVAFIESAVEPKQRKPYREPWMRPKSEAEEAEEEGGIRKLVRTVMEEVNNVKAIEARTTRVDNDSVV